MTTKVFVGNLAFQTTDQALAEAFSHCGTVKTGVIITRGRRSLGYGFVDFTSPDDASNAVKEMNQTEFLNRVIKVELVRDPPPRPPRQNVSSSTGLASPNNNNTLNSNNININNNTDNNDDGGEGGPAARRQRRKPRRRNNKRGRTDSQGNDIGPGQGGNPNQGGGNSGGGAPYREKPIHSNMNNNNNDDGGISSEAPPPRRRQQQRAPGGGRRIPNEGGAPPSSAPPKEKILSKTAVFVANLPFSVTDEGLAKIFESFNVKTAHVVKTRTERSRGYGFVDFATEQDQQRAINEKNNASIPSVTSNGNLNPRNISVTVSHSVAQNEENNTTQIQ